MNPKLKKNIETVVFLLIVFLMLSRVSFDRKIKQEIPAHIYENGIITGETTVVIDGERSNYLFTDEERFSGKFHILSYEKTGRPEMNAGIHWPSDENIQDILYLQNGTFPSMDIIRTLMINDKMTQFALMFADGTVIATSDEIYQLYTKHISYNSDTGVTSIEAVNTIPKI